MSLQQALIAAAILTALAMLGMAIGVLLGRRPLRGSCGGRGSCDCTDGRECPLKRS